MTKPKHSAVCLLSANLLILLILLGLLAACGTDASEATPVERWIDSPDKLHVVQSRAVDLAAVRAYHWTGAEISKWRRRETAEGVTLISPELDVRSALEIDTICVRVADFNGRSRFLLQWNDELEFSGSDGSRQRRELTARQGATDGVFVVRGDDIADVDLLGTASEEKAPRFLFLRFPAGPAGDVLFESLSVLGVDAAMQGRPHGWVRRTVAGEIRDAFFLSAPGVIEYRTDLSRGGDLAFGIQSPTPGKPIELAVSVGEEGTLLRRESIVRANRWRDVRISIPPVGGGTLTIRVGGDGPGRTVFLGNPMILRHRPEDDRPNVIVYVLDALRAEQTSLYGYSRKTTPFLDHIAVRGLLFQNAYSPVSWTKPSVVTLLTSLYPQVHGVGERSYSDVLPETAFTLQDALRENGYLTASFTANPLASTLSNLDQGFDETFTPNSFHIRNRKAKKDKIHSDDLNAEILPWLEAHARDRFMLYIHTVDPHVPFAAPETPPDLVGKGSDIDRYDAEIRFNDGQIERLWEKLVELGVAEDTLLIVTADHGEAFGEHGTTGHGTSVYQEEVRIPLLFYHPGRLGPRQVENPVQLIDLMPTILTYVGVPFDRESIQGHDVLDEDVLREESPVFLSRFAYPQDMDTERFNEKEYHAVVEGDWKLIAGSHRNRAAVDVELYHLGDDPGEQTDVKDRRPARARELRANLLAFLEDQTSWRTIFSSAHQGGEDSAPGFGEAAVSDEVLSQLRVLGYVE